MRNLLRRLIVASCAGLALTTAAGAALAQTDQWNALFDRIIRLEHEVRDMKAGGAGPLMAAGQAPAGDAAYRLSAVEEQLRQLIGEVQNLRRAQYEMELRLQQLDGRQKSGQLPPTVFDRQPVAQAQPPQATDTDLSPSYDLSQYDSQEIAGLGAETDVSIEVHRAPGPQVLGTITANQLHGQGQVAQPGLGDQQSATLVPEAVERAPLDGTQVPQTGGSAEGLYQGAYESLLGRRFGAAEANFKLFIDRHGDHPLAGDAQYWLGETYYTQGDYKQAAQAFLKGYRAYPQGRKAPDSLFKLALSLQQLGQKPQACSAFAEVAKEYPTAATIRNEAIKEMKRAGC